MSDKPIHQPIPDMAGTEPRLDSLSLLRDELAAFIEEVKYVCEEKSPIWKMAVDLELRLGINSLDALLSQVLFTREQVAAAFVAGFRCCRGYGDNHAHFDGEQREQKIAAYLLQIETGSVSSQRSERLDSERSAKEKRLQPVDLSRLLDPRSHDAQE